ncbi:hypothetical protein DFAR_3360004 [Desulfarculales bacterium]
MRQALLQRGLPRKLYLASLSIALVYSPPTCPRAGARSKDFFAPSGPSFSPASRAISFGTSMKP